MNTIETDAINQLRTVASRHKEIRELVTRNVDILASALRDAWAEIAEMRTTGTGYFHKNFRGHRPIPGEPLERITMIDTGLRLEAERDRLRAAGELAVASLCAGCDYKPKDCPAPQGCNESVRALRALRAALAGKGEYMDQLLPKYARAGQRLEAGAAAAFRDAFLAGAAGQRLERETAQDYPEDADNENGNYEHICPLCQRRFTGDKGRVVCKICFDASGDITQHGGTQEPKPDTPSPPEDAWRFRTCSDK